MKQVHVLVIYPEYFDLLHVIAFNVLNFWVFSLLLVWPLVWFWRQNNRVQSALSVCELVKVEWTDIPMVSGQMIVIFAPVAHVSLLYILIVSGIMCFFSDWFLNWIVSIH